MKSWLIFILGMITALLGTFLLLFIIGTQIELPADSQVGIVANATLNAEIAVEVPPQCVGLDLILTSECLQKQISTYFNYTIRDDVDRSLEDIKQFGGDCYDWNLLYKKWLHQLGFNAEMIVFPMDEINDHVITLAYTHNAYCILDQNVHPSCVVLGEIQ